MDDEQEVCFGMIIGLRFQLSAAYNPQLVPISLEFRKNDRTLFDSNLGCELGALDARVSKILSVLETDISVQLFADRISLPTAECSDNSTTSSRKRKRQTSMPSLNLFVVLYGPYSFFESVGNFASRCKLFLQHPRNCDRNVPYRNPHCLAPRDDNVVYTHNLDENSYSRYESQIGEFTNPIDLFADAREQDALTYAESPRALSTQLYDHQKQALTFMVQREGGWAMDGHHKDMWKEEKDSQGRVAYMNTITGLKQCRPPPQFRGGLLIDAPGLGKSLSIIALLLSQGQCQGRSNNGETSQTSATLLVVPKTLIQTWKDELQKHLKSSEVLKYCVYYGKDRTKLLDQLQNYKLVVTTYSLVRIDWKNSLKKPESLSTLHKIQWERVVLDEAHVIREPSKSFAKSVCALRARNRWAVTGTPIQNHLRDLFSLLKFLQCFPFDDLKVFNTHVAENWKRRSDPICVAKLKTLVNSLSLRRPKTIIKLPARNDISIHLDFSKQERQYYEEVRKSTRHKIDSANRESNNLTFLNALKWLNELRLICNHGVTHKKFTKTLEEAPTGRQILCVQGAQECFDQLDTIGFAKCSNPLCSQDLSSKMSSEIDTEHYDEPRIDDQLKLWCSTCSRTQVRAASKMFKICNHYPRRYAKTQDGSVVDPSVTSARENHVFGNGENIPSKIKHLLQDLCETPDGVKSVVFSSWTKTLDLIHPQLIEKSIRYVRLDGTLSATGRDNVIRVFRTNPDIRVLLATISCGGIGLDLTVASRAYIMEPQWNPMSESQALDRIHRLGQLKEVQTIRYIMRGSYEEKVLSLQAAKQGLADLTLGTGALNKIDVEYGRLQYLKDLVG